MIGLSYCSSFVLLPFWVALLSLLTWIYASYSGQMPAIVQVIDAGAEAVADQVGLTFLISFKISPPFLS
ncbi:unnamed protein product [Protopolystoma xenopodis]|uniref:Uncharacterized protein n=1 Tax=Protopolystoma xenopodis TaxID=117903 RepID=A0A448WNE3_9PLAT|nr:unnamed protein product [Protopolystoma xenopodis]